MSVAAVVLQSAVATMAVTEAAHTAARTEVAEVVGERSVLLRKHFHMALCTKLLAISVTFSFKVERGERKRKQRSLSNDCT